MFKFLKTGKLKAFKPLMTTAGFWEPTNGLTTQDAVFPHIAQGFRNRTMPIATFHVCLCQNSKDFRNIFIETFNKFEVIKKNCQNLIKTCQ